MTTAGAVVAGSSYIYLSYFNKGFDNPIAFPRSLTSIMDVNTIREIGDAYRQQFPNEASGRNILKLLGAESAQEIMDGSVLQIRITKDFEAGNTKMINGWVLSLTELRQCALFSLQRNK